MPHACILCSRALPEASSTAAPPGWHVHAPADTHAGLRIGEDSPPHYTPVLAQAPGLPPQPQPQPHLSSQPQRQPHVSWGAPPGP
jgi:hypothetical protein